MWAGHRGLARSGRSPGGDPEGVEGSESGMSAANRSLRSPGSIPSTRNRFCREVAPEIRLTWPGLQVKGLGQQRLDRLVGLSLSGGAVTATRSAPARSPRIALRSLPVEPAPARPPRRDEQKRRSRLEPFEDCRADANERCSFENGGLEVTRHPH